MNTKKLTRTTVQALSNKHIRLGYCEASYLLRPLERIGYNSGVYGWNYDAFLYRGVVITTGYRGMIGNRPAVSVEPFEKRAEMLSKDSNISYEEYTKKALALLDEFIENA